MKFKNLGSGDSGNSCFGKKWVSKTCPEIEALGSLDELNSLLGLIRNQKISQGFKRVVFDIQQNLFIIQTIVASTLFGKKIKEFPEVKILEIEKNIQEYSNRVGQIDKFIVPGTDSVSAWLDYARAIARRVERKTLLI